MARWGALLARPDRRALRRPAHHPAGARRPGGHARAPVPRHRWRRPRALRRRAGHACIAAWDLQPLGLPGSFLVDAFDVLGFFSVFSTPWFLLLMTVLVVSIIVLHARSHADAVARRTARCGSSSRRRSSTRAATTAVHSGRRLQAAAAMARSQRAFRARHFRRQRSASVDGATHHLRRPQPVQKLATLLTHAGLVLFLARWRHHRGPGLRDRRLRGRRTDRAGAGGGYDRQPAGQEPRLLGSPARADGSFADFSTDLSVFRNGEEIARQTIRVNDPLAVDDFVFHQNTFGPTARLTIDRRGRAPGLGRAAAARR